MKLLTTFLATTSIILPLVGCSSDAPDSTGLQHALSVDKTRAPNPLRVEPPRTKTEGPTAGKPTGMAKDLRLLRKTIAISEGRKASSLEAVEAAKRVFGRINFVGMTKKNVLWMLGDPETISDFGLKAGPGDDDPLTYRMDGGTKPFDWIIRFKDGRVTAVEERKAAY